MNDDEFLKELEEVTKDLEKEYSKVSIPEVKSNTATSSTTNINNKPQQQMPNNPGMDPNMNFANLFQNFDFSNDSKNIDQLKKMFSDFDDNDPESKEMLQRISKN